MENSSHNDKSLRPDSPLSGWCHHLPVIPPKWRGWMVALGSPVSSFMRLAARPVGQAKRIGRSCFFQNPAGGVGHRR